MMRPPKCIALIATLTISFIWTCKPAGAFPRVDELKPSESAQDQQLYQRRVAMVRQTPGLVAFWDFVNRTDGPNGIGPFVAYTDANDPHQYALEPHNFSHDFWNDGKELTYAEIPLLGRGPFGQAVHFVNPESFSHQPVLLVPRKKLHDSPLDIKGPGASASMVVWMVYQSGVHAIAGMWHEGTDSPTSQAKAVVRECGRRQFGLFAGLSANPGSCSIHLSENGLSSFGDTYARHMAATREQMPRTPGAATEEQLDAGWCAVGFVFDNQQKCATAYLNGVATEYWIDNPEDGFYQSTVRAWKQARLARRPGNQKGEDPNFPQDQFYEPPENEVLTEKVVTETNTVRVVIRTYTFTKVRMTLHKDANDQFTQVVDAELVSLKANPYYFGHDIYAPQTVADGGPFTIGRVIHSNRSKVALSAYIGGVAVFDKALSLAEMKILSEIGRPATTARGEPSLIRHEHLNKTP